MPRQQLQETLKALHEELESNGQLSEDDREALLRSLHEIQEALARGDKAAPAAEQVPPSGRVSALIEEFEGSHPRLTELLQRVADSLSNLGI